ncbi:MAG: thiamine pyrophosphate-dependent enzyme [Nanopusillaceae archaeon]
MLKRREVLDFIFREVKSRKAIVITTTGLIGRESFEIVGYEKHFYMAGSMGLSSSIGLGIALFNSKIKVISIDGDGSLLMNLGGMCTIGYWKPKNFIHVVLDNGVYYSSGGMKTYSRSFSLEKIAKELGYRKTFLVKNKKELIKSIRLALKEKGPIFIRVFIEPTGRKKLPRPNCLVDFHHNIRNILKKMNKV